MLTSFRNVSAIKRDEIKRSLWPLFVEVVDCIPLILVSDEKPDLDAIYQLSPFKGVTKLLAMIEAYQMRGWVQFLSCLELRNLNHIRELFVSEQTLKGLAFEFKLLDISSEIQILNSSLFFFIFRIAKEVLS